MYVQYPFIELWPNSYIPLIQLKCKLCSIMEIVHYCEKIHLLRHKSKHICTPVTYYQIDSMNKAMHSKSKHAINLTSDPTILDVGNLILLPNLPKPWMLVCVLENISFLLDYSINYIINYTDFVNVPFQGDHTFWLKQYCHVRTMQHIRWFIQ